MDSLELIKKFGKDPAQKAWQQVMRSYHEGEQTIPELEGPRIDGRPKSRIITNWTAYAVTMYTGFLTTKDVTYSLPADADKTALNNLVALYDALNANAADTEHLENCLVHGFSVEVYAHDDEITLALTDPLAWEFFVDEHKVIRAGVYKVDVPAGTIYKDELLSKIKTLFYVYTATSIQLYEQDGTGFALIQDSPHHFGRLPLTVFTISKNWKSYFTKAWTSSCNAYDIVRSSHVDSVRYGIDRLLVFKGLTVNELLEQKVIGKDAQGGDITTSIAETMRQQKMLCLPQAGADVTYLACTLDHEAVEFDLKKSREELHIQARIPDLDSASGANGTITNISGIALKMKFQPMIQQAGKFIKFFEMGLKNRVAVINHMWALKGKPALNGYDVKVSMYLPQDEISILQYLANLKGVLPQEHLMKLAGLDRPHEAAAQVNAENKNAADGGSQTPPDAITE